MNLRFLEKIIVFTLESNPVELIILKHLELMDVLSIPIRVIHPTIKLNTHRSHIIPAVSRLEEPEF